MEAGSWAHKRTSCFEGFWYAWYASTYAETSSEAEFSNRKEKVCYVYTRPARRVEVKQQTGE